MLNVNYNIGVARVVTSITLLELDGLAGWKRQWRALAGGVAFD